MTSFSVALIGVGAMGALHARVVGTHPRTELVAVIDADVARAATLASEFGGSALPADAELPACDAVIIASPTETHVAWAMKAISADKPVLIEKPIAETHGETIAILDAARTADVPVTCGFVERFNPVLAEALKIAEDTVHLSVLRHSPYPERIKTGVASDLLVHDIDLALRLADDLPLRVAATFSSVDPRSGGATEDLAEAQLTFESGLVATLSASRVAQRKIRTASFAALDRTVEADLLRRDLAIYRHVGNELVNGSGGGYRQQTIMEIPMVPAAREPLVAQLEHFLGLIEGDVDFAVESNGILGPHRVLEMVRTAAGRDS